MKKQGISYELLWGQRWDFQKPCFNRIVDGILRYVAYDPLKRTDARGSLLRRLPGTKSNNLEHRTEFRWLKSS